MIDYLKIYLEINYINCFPLYSVLSYTLSWVSPQHNFIFLLHSNRGLPSLLFRSIWYHDQPLALATCLDHFNFTFKIISPMLSIPASSFMIIIIIVFFRVIFNIHFTIILLVNLTFFNYLFCIKAINAVNASIHSTLFFNFIFTSDQCIYLYLIKTFNL